MFLSRPPAQVIPATSSRPRLLAFLDPRRSRRAGGSEPAGPRAPPPLLDHLVKQHSGPGLNPSRFDHLVKLGFRAGRTRAHLVRAWGTSRRRIVGDSLLYQLQNPYDPKGLLQNHTPTTPHSAGRQAPPSGPGVKPGGRMGGWLCVNKERPAQQRRVTLVDATPLLTAKPTMQTPGRRSGYGSRGGRGCTPTRGPDGAHDLSCSRVIVGIAASALAPQPHS